MKNTLVLLLGLYPVFLLADAINKDEKSITIALTQEPPSLNSLKATDLVSYFVLGHVNEGLLRYDRRGLLAPGVAQSFNMDETKMTFELRSDARWSNGKPVTAHDFVFAWQLMVDAAFAAPAATIMYPIKNAKKIHQGQIDTKELGVRAIDSRNLEVQLESPCGHCLNLMTNVSFFPINAEFYHTMGEEYGADAQKMLYNGPFVIESWIHDVSLSMAANKYYWGKADINLARINVGYITSDNRTRLNLFRDNRIALVRLGAETIKDAATHGLRLKTFLSGGMFFLRFGFSAEKASHYSEVRKAIQLVVDPAEFTNKVIAMPGYKPAFSFFPGWLEGKSGKFIKEFPPRRLERDEKKARAYIERLRTQIKSETGADIPSLTLLTVTSPTGTKIAEYFQGLLKEKLGLDVRVDQQTFKQYLQKIRSGDFDIALSSAYPEFNDIVTYADLMASWNPNNRGGYSSAEYDRWLSVLQKSIVIEDRLEAASRLQALIIEDVPVLPLAETGSTYLQHAKLEGVVRRVLGADPDYAYARIVD